MRTIRLTATTVTAAYLAVGTAWVAASDIAASDLPDWVGTAKGMAFVCLTGAPLWALLRRRDRAIAAREETLLAAHARLSAVAESEGTFTCLFDAEGRIRYATRSVATVLGMTADELHERDSLELVHPADRPRVRVAAAGVFRQPGGGATVQYRLRRADGSYRWVRTTLTNRLDDPVVQGLVGNTYDVDDLLRRERLISGLLRGAAALASTETAEEVAEAVLAACLSATGLDGGTVRVLDESKRLVPLATHRTRGAARLEPLDLDGPTLSAEAARTQRIVSASGDGLAALPPGAVPDGVGAAMYVPMLSGTRCVGVIGVGGAQLDPIDSSVRATLMAFAHQAALAFERARLSDARRRALTEASAAAQRATALADVAQAFARVERVDDVLAEVVRAIVDVLSPSAVTTSLVGERTVRPSAQFGLAALIDEDRIAPSYRRPPAATLRDGRERWYESLEELEADAGALQPGDEVLWRAGAVVPLVDGTAVVGVVAIGFDQPHRWKHDEQEFLRAVVGLSNEAVRRAQRFEDARAAAANYQDLFDGYERLFRRHPQPMLVWDEQTFAILAVNDALLDAFGYSRPELDRLTVLDLIASDELDRALDARLSQPHGVGEIFHIGLVHMRRRDGSSFVVEATGHDAQRFAGRPARLALLIDQTARVEAELARRDLEERVVTVAEAERRRLAGDLHDGPVQQLSVAAMRLAALRRHSERGDPVPAERIEPIEKTVAASIDELRGVMMHLYPPTLDELSLADAIRDVLTDVSMLDGVKVTLCDNLRHPVRGPVKTALYRVVVEALANVRKHAAASAVTIALDEHDEVIDLRVIDDGVGIAEGVNSRPNHLGLVTMRDRLLLLGGACRIEPAPGGGTVVRAVVPVGASAPREIDPNPLI